MEKYRLNESTPLTSKLISKYIEKDAANSKRLKKLKNYYEAKHDINKKTVADNSKPNNRVTNPYANYITDLSTGYFMGEPIKYSSDEEALLSEIEAIFDYNDEAAENSELAKDASICGIAYEIMYIDRDKQIRFTNVSPIGCIPIYDDTIEQEMLYFIRYYDSVNIENDEVTTIIDVYTRDKIQHYTQSSFANDLSFVGEEIHNWGLVPVIDYYNNAEAIGDFEPVISEIDAYDELVSESLNEMDYFADAYLALHGMSGTDSNDIASMKENRVLLLPAEGKAEWLIKEENDTYVENQKTRLDKDIHKFSGCPAMTDSDFAQNASGVAMKYKLLGLENKTSKKERAFKKGLQRRLELICNMLSVFGVRYDYRSIDIIFTRNIPADMTEIANIINTLGTLLSEETKMNMLPIEIDYEAEQAKKKEEQEANYSINFDFPIDDEDEEEE